MAITKLADALLHDYQQRVLDKLKNPEQKGLIAWHSTGSGKTLTALKALQEARERTGKPGLFITPASLVENAKKEIVNHKLPLSDLQIMSYEKAQRHLDELEKQNYGLIAFDEAHRLRNSNTERVRRLRNLIGKADKSLLLTGTAGYNGPADIGALANLVDSNLKFPGTPREFDEAFVNKTTGKLKNTKRIHDTLGPVIDYYERPKDAADFPSIQKELVRVPMSDKQQRLYNYLIQKLPSHLRMAVKKNIPLDNKDAAALNQFATGVRQASLSPMHHDMTAKPEDSPKLIEAANRMAEAARAPHFRGVAYSNYIDAGLNPYAELLRKKGLEPLVFTGGMSAKEKKALVDAYNSPDEKAKILLLSSSGGEGLDLKGTRRLQILEPHFNQAKIDQVMGRGARYRSHADLPEKDRNLVVEQFHSVMPKRWYHKLFGSQPDYAIDDYLDQMSQRKSNLINGVIGALR